MFTSWNSTRKFREIKNTEKFLERSIKHDPKSNPYVQTVHKYSLIWHVAPSLILGTQQSSAKFKARYPLPNCASLEVTCGFAPIRRAKTSSSLVAAETRCKQTDPAWLPNTRWSYPALNDNMEKNVDTNNSPIDLSLIHI